MKNLTLIAAIFIAHYTTGLFGQAGSLDPTFGAGGIDTTKVITSIGTTNSIANSVVVQPDGKIVIAGVAYNSTGVTIERWLVARYNTDGTLDQQFADNGIITSTFGNNIGAARSLAIQSDGKIVVAGYVSDTSGSPAQFAAARYNTDGTLDIGFGTGGKVTTGIFNHSNSSAYTVTIQQDGKIVMAGYAFNGIGNDIAVARFNANGVPDDSFGINGGLSTFIGSGNNVIYSVAIQPDGKIAVAGRNEAASDFSDHIVLVRYKTNGSLDPTFGMNGIVISSIGSYSLALSMVLQPDNKILIGGVTSSTLNNGFLIARYNSNGSPDPSFNGTGHTITTIGLSNSSGAHSIVTLPNGDIIAVGQGRNDLNNFDFALAKYHMNGKADSTFGSNGIVVTDFGNIQNYGRSVAYHDGKIIVAGGIDDGLHFNIMLARYFSGLSLGILDFSAPQNHVQVTGYP